MPDVRFVILGEGELRPQLEKQIKHLHLERHVFLAGFRADVLELMKDFDVFALSSTHEGMCTSLVDAMAAEKPAVATAVGGVPEVVADAETGFLVPPHDPAALAARIVQLLKDQTLRRRMGRGRPRSGAAAVHGRADGAAKRRRSTTRTGRQQACAAGMRDPAGAVESAGIHHPDMTEREVEADGIGRIDAAQRRRDVGGHLPPG